MPAVIRSLHNIEGTIVYPETIVTAVHMPDGRRNLLDVLELLKDGSCTTEFNDDGSITTTYTNSGISVLTEFGDAVITETATYSDETPYYVKTTTFNDDGSITELYEFADNSSGTDDEEVGGE